MCHVIINLSFKEYGHTHGEISSFLLSQLICIVIFVLACEVPSSFVAISPPLV